MRVRVSVADGALRSSRGIMSVVVAVGIVSLLAVLSLTLSMASAASQRRLMGRMDRLEAFAMNEISMWHLYERSKAGLSGGTPAGENRFLVTLENDYSRSITGIADPYPADRGTPLNVITTIRFAPSAVIVRRLNSDNAAYHSPSTSTYCGQIHFSKKQKTLHACLATVSSGDEEWKKLRIIMKQGTGSGMFYYDGSKWRMANPAETNPFWGFEVPLTYQFDKALNPRIHTVSSGPTSRCPSNTVPYLIRKTDGIWVGECAPFNDPHPELGNRMPAVRFAFDSRDRVYSVLGFDYRSESDPNAPIAMQFYTNGSGGWVEDSTFSNAMTGLESFKEYRIAIDREDFVHVVTSAVVSGVPGLYYTHNRGGSWSVPGLIPETDDGFFTFKILFDSKELRPHLFFKRCDVMGSEYGDLCPMWHFAPDPENPSAWRTNEIRQSVSVYSIEADNAGGIHLVYESKKQSIVNTQLNYGQYFGEWSFKENISASYERVSGYPVLTMNDRGIAIAVLGNGNKSDGTPFSIRITHRAGHNELWTTDVLPVLSTDPAPLLGMLPGFRSISNR